MHNTAKIVVLSFIFGLACVCLHLTTFLPFAFFPVDKAEWPVVAVSASAAVCNLSLGIAYLIMSSKVDSSSVENIDRHLETEDIDKDSKIVAFSILFGLMGICLHLSSFLPFAFYPEDKAAWLVVAVSVSATACNLSLGIAYWMAIGKCNSISRDQPE